MKIFEFKENSWYSTCLYNILEMVFNFGRRYFPKLFYKQCVLDNHYIYLNRWMTKREYDYIKTKTDKLANSINWN